jgi:hypothetical protein
MIIYFPVSALVTIFANVLQNPQDARARSDIRLMHQVVSFLSVLAVDEETGGVKRMLDVCQEFERIAKIVLEKSDKESHSRRKRKIKDDDDPPARPAPERKTPNLGNTPKAQHTPTSSVGLTPNYNNPSTDLVAPRPASANSNTANPPTAAPAGPTPGSSGPATTHSPNPSATHQFSSPLSQPAAAPAAVTMLPEFVTRPGDWPNPYTEFGDMNQFNGINSPLNMGGNMQPQFAGQDMWNMPMNFDWDWANLSNEAAGQDGVPVSTAGGFPPGSGPGAGLGVSAAELQQVQQARGM